MGITILFPNLKKMKLTDNEKNGDFKLEYIPLKNVKKVLKENTKTNEQNKKEE